MKTFKFICQGWFKSRDLWWIKPKIQSLPVLRSEIMQSLTQSLIIQVRAESFVCEKKVKTNFLHFISIVPPFHSPTNIIISYIKVQWHYFFTDPCGRRCEETSHQPEGSVPLTSTEAPLPPPAHTGVESADLQMWSMVLTFVTEYQAFTQLRGICNPVPTLEDYNHTDHSTKWAKGKLWPTKY